MPVLIGRWLMKDNPNPNPNHTHNPNHTRNPSANPNTNFFWGQMAPNRRMDYSSGSFFDHRMKELRI